MMQPTLFDLHGVSRIAEWKLFRESLENSNNPLIDTVKIWCKAPFVNRYLDPNLPETWPDPWELILENKYDDLGLALGQLYTLQLTERFKNSKFDVLAVTSSDSLYEIFAVLVNNTYILNLEYMTVKSVADFKEPLVSRTLWSSN